MKKCLFIIISLLLLLNINKPSYVAFAEKQVDNIDDVIEKELDAIDFTEIEKYIKDNKIELPKNFSTIIKNIINGEFSLDYSSVFKYFTEIIFSNVKQIMPNLITVIIIALLYKIISTLNGAINEVKDIIYVVMLSCIVTTLLPIINQCIIVAEKTLTNVNNIINVISPIILTLMIASGASVLASIYQPAVIFYGNIISGLITTMILPVIKIIITLNFVTCLFPELKLNGYISFLNSIVKWILGISFTIFSLFISVQGITGGNIDGVTLRATKYAITNTVPIIGGFISGGFNLVVAGSVLIKNALGVGAIILLFYTVASPLLFIISVQLTLKGVSAIISTVSDEKISSMCLSTSKNLSLITTSLLGTVFTFFIFNIIIIVSATSLI